jgi:hypothetical protein
MNAENITRELELAAWEMAEATTREKAAASLRASSAKRIAAVHLEIAAAIRAAKEAKNLTIKQTL